MKDPMHEMAEARKKGYQREAQARRTHEGLLPWAQRIPWSVLGWGTKVLCVVGVIGAVAGLSFWAMALPLATAIFQVSADLPRRRRAAPFRARLQAVAMFLAPLAIGGFLVHQAPAWLADWAIPQVTLEVIAWAMVSIGVWAVTCNAVVLASLMMMPLPADEMRFPRGLYVDLHPDVFDALRGIVGDQLKDRKNEVVGQAIVHYANHLAGRGLDREAVQGPVDE